MTDLSKTFSLAEVEGFLAAERERCAKVADKTTRLAEKIASSYCRGTFMEAHHKGRHEASEQIAAAIRNLAPEPRGGE